MAETRGYIKVYRCIQDNELWMRNEPFDRRSAFVDLLLMANHEEKTISFNKGTLTLQRGQLHTSIYKLSDRWHWSRPRTVRFLDTLCELGMVTTNRTTSGTTITIVNYGKFQNVGATNVTTNVTKGVTANVTTDVTTDVTQTINKENKNIRSKEKKKAAPLSPNAGKPKYHIIDEYEYWYEDGMWCRELINKGDANGDISG